MSQVFFYPPTSVTFSDPAEGPFGDPLPAEGIAVGAEDPSGDLAPLKVNALGELLVDISSALPADVTIVGPLGQALMAASIPVVIASNQSTLPVSAASLPLPAGAATSANQVSEIGLLTTIDADTGNIATSTASIDTKTPALGQALMAVSVPVAIASNQSALPISAASLPLPSGAATEATLSTLNGKVTACNTGAVVVSSSALPTGAATETTLAAASAKLPATLGQKTSANSMAVVIASDQSALPVAASNGMAKANAPTYYDYTSGSVTTAAYTQLIASTTSAAKVIEIFDSSGQALFLAVGAAASEVDQLFIIPGGNGQVSLAIPAGSRISIKAKTATASSGYIVVNLYG